MKRYSPARLITTALALGIAIAATPGSALAAGAVLFRDHGMFAAVSHEPNICGWPATFDGHGQYGLVVVDATAGTFHITYHETDNWTLVVDDDPSVPEALRLATWRGRNEFTYVLNADPSTDRVVEITLNPNSEGPFHGLLERITLVVDQNGTVRVDQHEFVGTVDCSLV